MEAIVFDLDGVLVDVRKSYRKAIRETAQAFTGKPLSAAKIKALKEEGGYNNDWELTAELIRRSGIDVPFNEVVAAFQAKYFGGGFDGYIQAEEPLADSWLLEQASKKYRLAVFTGRPREEAAVALRRFGYASFFEVVVAMEDIPKNKGKPSPYGLEFIRQRLGFGHGGYAGDTVDDMRCAKAAGFTAVGVLPPDADSTTIKKLQAAGATSLFDNVNQFLEAVR